MPYPKTCQLRFRVNLPELGAVTWVLDIWWIGGVYPPGLCMFYQCFHIFGRVSGQRRLILGQTHNCQQHHLVPACPSSSMDRFSSREPFSDAMLAMPCDARCCECTPAKCSWTTSTMQLLGVGAIGTGLKPTKPPVLRY